jgi:hypothetical protein
VVSLGTSKYLTKGGKYTLKLLNSTPLKKATSKVSKRVKNNILKKFDDWKTINTGVNRVYRSARKLGVKTKEGIKRLAGFKQQKHSLEGLEGAAKHELYKKQLRQTMPKPNVQDTKLKKIANNLYRPNAKVGNGSTADALRYEKLNGGTVAGKEHAIKARERVTNLRSWLKNNPNASSSDKSAAEQMMLDLMDALGDI